MQQSDLPTSPYDPAATLLTTNLITDIDFGTGAQKNVAGWTACADGDTVGRIVNAVAGSNNPVIAVAGAPKFRASAFCGKGGVEIVPSVDAFYGSDLFPLAPSPVTIYFLYERTGGYGDTAPYLTNADEALGESGFSVRTSAGGVYAVATVQAGPSSGRHVIIGHVDMVGAGVRITSYRGLRKRAETAVTATLVELYNGTNIPRSQLGAHWFGGYLGRMLVYSAAHSDAQRIQVTQFLRREYRLP